MRQGAVQGRDVWRSERVSACKVTDNCHTGRATLNQSLCMSFLVLHVWLKLQLLSDSSRLILTWKSAYLQNH